MTARITKHFITVGRRRVHYLRAGEGPVVALLHASACSAKVLRLPIEVFSTRFTAIAFDTPGFGLSDLLEKVQPETEDLADGLADTLAAMGIGQVAAYGRHTGAQVAVEFGVRHPERCALALTDGYPMFSPSHQWADLSEYLAPIRPTFAGEHLLWLWFRYRDQHVFWPWNEQRLEKRADSDVPDLDYLHRGVIEFLEAGDDYKTGYATAFRHHGLRALQAAKIPICLGVRPGDSLYATRKLYPPGAWVEEMPREAIAAACAELAILAKHPASGNAPAAPRCAPIAGRSTTEYVDLGDTQILTRSIGDLRAAAPIVVLHHAPGSSALYESLVREIGRQHPVIAFDLPGHGESDPLPGMEQSIDVWAKAARRTLDACGVGAMHLYGHNGGACVAAHLAELLGDRVRSMTLDAPICLTDALQADIAPRWLDGVDPVMPCWDGSHLLRVWHMRRDMELWWPWNVRRHANARTTAPRIDPARLTLEVREAMKQPASFVPAWRAVMHYPMLMQLARTRTPALLIAAPQDVFARCLPTAHSVRPDARSLEIADTDAARAEAILSNAAGAA